MPISIGSKTWKFCKSCDSLSRKKNKYCQYDIPEVNHKEIASRAFTIFKYGLISKEEYITIVEADLKCRGSPDVIDSHFKKPLNLDPITLEELGDFKYTFITPTGVCIHYNLQSFVYYLRTTQDFLDPVTRLPLERDDIERIHSMIQQHQPNLSIPSIIELYDKINKLKNINNDRENDNNNNNNNNVNNVENNENEIKSNLNQIRELQSMEACLGELITDMLRLIEKKKSPYSSANEDLEYKMLVIFSEFETPFQEFKKRNLEGSYHALQSWISFIKGPSRKPTKDNSGLLNQTISFLKAQWTESDQEKLCILRHGNPSTDIIISLSE